MTSWNVRIVYDRTLPEDQAGDLMDRLTDMHAIAGWEPDTQRFSITMTLDAVDAGMALAVARWAASGAIHAVYGAVLGISSAEVMTEEEQDRRLAQ